MPNLFRRTTNRNRTGAAAALMLGTCLASLSPANASSITRIGPEQVAAQSLEKQSDGSASSQTVRRSPVSAATCARDFHPKLAEIADGPFQRIKAAIATPATGATGAGEVSANGLIFGPPTRSRSSAETSAVRAAVAAARSGGVAAVPVLDANARWTAQRIREDLGDFLTQGPSPYLCAGIDNYLETLRDYAGRIGTSCSPSSPKTPRSPSNRT